MAKFQAVERVWRAVRRWRWWAVGAAVMAAMVLVLPVAYAVHATRGKEFTVASAPSHRVAIIFGAGVLPDHRPTSFLESRLLAGAALYKTGKAKVLLVSGDNHTTHYDEPTAMRDYLMSRGVPKRAIVLDYAGYDTYATCYRARHIFRVTSATLVTHGYHLPRALMLCNRLGVQSVGVRADRTGASYSKSYWLREVLALDEAVLELTAHHKPAVLGPPDPGVANALRAER